MEFTPVMTGPPGVVVRINFGASSWANARMEAEKSNAEWSVLGVVEEDCFDAEASTAWGEELKQREELKWVAPSIPGAFAHQATSSEASVCL